MKSLYIFFFIAVTIFITITTLRLQGIAMPGWVQFYVNDFLCMPIVLTICLKAVHFIKKDATLKLPIAPIFTLTLFYAIYFELYLPGVSTRYTGDWLDVVMYFAGALVFYFLQFRK